MKNLHPYLLFEPAFLWLLLLQYAHYFVCVSQNNRAKRKRLSRLFYLTESDTIHTNMGSIVEQNKNIMEINTPKGVHTQ